MVLNAYVKNINDSLRTVENEPVVGTQSLQRGQIYRCGIKYPFIVAFETVGNLGRFIEALSPLARNPPNADSENKIYKTPGMF